jgi:ATP-dependent RNA helicase DDX56/DBP9
MLMSATSSEEVERLQKLVLHNPVTLNLLQQPQDGPGGGTDGADAAGGGSGAASEITHFMTHCAPADKMLVTMALLKLGLVRKKVRPSSIQQRLSKGCRPHHAMT